MKKRKPAARKKKAAKTKAKPTPALKERLEAEFAQAVKIARSYVDNPQRLQALFHDAAREAASIPREPFQEMWRFPRSASSTMLPFWRWLSGEVARIWMTSWFGRRARWILKRRYNR